MGSIFSAAKREYQSQRSGTAGNGEERVCPDGLKARPDTNFWQLERHSQTKLNEAREIVLARNLPNGRSIAIGWIKLWTIERVEELGSELKAYSVFRTKPGVLEDGKIKVLNAIVSNVRLGS